MEINSIELTTSIDQDLSDELNLQQKALDDVWLLQQVSEGLMSREVYTQLQSIRSLLQQIYPDNWDLQLQVQKTLINVVYEHTPEPEPEPEPEPVTAPVIPYGAYFGYENRLGTASIFNDRREYYTVHNSPPTTVTYTGNELVPETPIGEAVTKVVKHLNFLILIKFPEIVITNTRRQKHTIRDLFVRIKFESRISILDHPYYVRHDREKRYKEDLGDNITQTLDMGDNYEPINYRLKGYRIKHNMDGMRGIVTPAEYQSCYAHSHLGSRSGNVFTEWGGYCLGSGEINETFTMLSVEFNMGLFELLLHQITVYVRWESIEGAPFIRMDTITSGVAISDYKVIDRGVIDNYYSRLCVYLRNYSTNLNEVTGFDWKIKEDGHLEVVENEKFYNFCKYESNVHNYSYSDRVIYYRDNQGALYDFYNAQRVGMPSNPDLGREYLYKGEYHTLKFFQETDVTASDNFHIHPAIINYIKTKIESYANYNKVKGNIIARANRLNNLPPDLR